MTVIAPEQNIDRALRRVSMDDVVAINRRSRFRVRSLKDLSQPGLRLGLEARIGGPLYVGLAAEGLVPLLRPHAAVTRGRGPGRSAHRLSSARQLRTPVERSYLAVRHRLSRGAGLSASPAQEGAARRAVR